MTLASIASALPFVLLVLACPLMMIFMMRGMHGGQSGAGHGHGGHRAGGCGMHGGDGSHGADPPETLEELRRRRDELDDEIARREQEPAEPVGSRR